MKKLSVFIFLLSMTATVVSAQKKLAQVPKTEEWAEKPSIHDLPQGFTTDPALILTYDITKDYRYEGRGINVYYTMHRIVKVLDDRGIEMYNKVSIPVGSRTRVPLIKARTILPDGKVKEIAKDMIKVTKNEYGQYEIVFAMEGVEKNAEIELLIKEIRQFSMFGSESFQFPVPVLKSHFDLSYPKELVFEERGYNGYPDVTDTLLHNRRHISVTMTNIPALHSEPNSYYDVHRMRAEYRIHKFINENNIDSAKIYTWDNLARQIYENHYKITSKERAAVNQYLITLDARPTNKEEVNVRKIEDGIKKNIVLYPEMDEPDEDNLDSIINNKAATPSGYIKLFAACFTQAEVKHELGMAYNRTEHFYDKSFENWGNLDYYLFYFPNLKKFLSPENMYTRYPIVPEEVLNTHGIFCSIPPKRDVTSPLGEIKKITPLSCSESQDNIAAGVTFDKNMDAKVDISYSFTGYSASALRTQLLLEPKSKEKELVEKIVTVADKPEQIASYTITNSELEHSYANAPLEITATVNSAGLTEKAGPQYLLKIGALLGPHTTLYDDKKRVMPVDLGYPATMNRTITVNIPKGYKIVNPEALKVHADFVNRDLKPVISFDATYAIKQDRKNGDKLIVTVTESCPQTHFAVADYEHYREVVNAAADYNKVTLLMAKKG